MGKLEGQHGKFLDTMQVHFEHLVDQYFGAVGDQEKVDVLAGVDLGEMIVEMELHRKGKMGRMKSVMEALDDARNYFRKIDAELQLKDVPESDRIVAVFSRISEAFPFRVYRKGQADLSDLLRMRGGNCEARMLYMMSVIFSSLLIA